MQASIACWLSRGCNARRRYVERSDGERLRQPVQLSLTIGFRLMLAGEAAMLRGMPVWLTSTGALPGLAPVNYKALAMSMVLSPSATAAVGAKCCRSTSNKAGLRALSSPLVVRLLNHRRVNSHHASFASRLNRLKC